MSNSKISHYNKWAGPLADKIAHHEHVCGVLLAASTDQKMKAIGGAVMVDTRIIRDAESISSAKIQLLLQRR
jgi:hypothetical protein